MILLTQYDLDMDSIINKLYSMLSTCSIKDDEDDSKCI